MFLGCQVQISVEKPTVPAVGFCGFHEPLFGPCDNSMLNCFYPCPFKVVIHSQSVRCCIVWVSGFVVKLTTYNRFIFLCWPHRKRAYLYFTTVYEWELLYPFALYMYLLNVLSTLSLWNNFCIFLSSIPFISGILSPSSSRVSYEIKCSVKLNMTIGVS